MYATKIGEMDCVRNGFDWIGEWDKWWAFKEKDDYDRLEAYDILLLEDTKALNEREDLGKRGWVGSKL